VGRVELLDALDALHELRERVEPLRPLVVGAAHRNGGVDAFQNVGGHVMAYRRRREL
jgi:hypothetical protein